MNINAHAAMSLSECVSLQIANFNQNFLGTPNRSVIFSCFTDIELIHREQNNK